MNRRLNGATYGSYKPDETMSVPQRTAHFLDWYAKQAPKRLIAMPDLTKLVNILPKRPGVDSKEVALQRSRNQAVKKLLEDTYGRSLISIPGRGIRASVDGEDFASGCLRPTMARLHSISRRAQKQAAMVKMNEVTSPETRNFVNKTRKVIKEIDPDTLLHRLALPPKQESEEDTTE